MADTTIGMDVLVVDDQPMSREVLGEALRPLGCRIRQVADAREALMELRLRHYPLMFIDLVMPDMDGYALARQVRRIEEEHKRPHAALVAYSGTLYAEDGKVVEMERNRLLESGFDEGLAKPLEMDSLQGVIDTLFEHGLANPQGNRHEAPAPSTAAKQAEKPKELKLCAAYAMPNPAGPFGHALIVDDDRFSLATAQVQVEGCISHVTIAPSAREALRMFCEQPYDLVLLDLEMPDTDGFTLAARMRLLEAGMPHRTCIVALSGHLSTPEMLRRCAAAGMDDCLTKPFNAKLFRMRLDLWQRGHYPAQKLSRN